MSISLFLLLFLLREADRPQPQQACVQHNARDVEDPENQQSLGTAHDSGPAEQRLEKKWHPDFLTQWSRPGGTGRGRVRRQFHPMRNRPVMIGRQAHQAEGAHVHIIEAGEEPAPKGLRVSGFIQRMRCQDGDSYLSGWKSIRAGDPFNFQSETPCHRSRTIAKNFRFLQLPEMNPSWRYPITLLDGPWVPLVPSWRGS